MRKVGGTGLYSVTVDMFCRYTYSQSPYIRSNNSYTFTQRAIHVCTHIFFSYLGCPITEWDNHKFRLFQDGLWRVVTHHVGMSLGVIMELNSDIFFFETKSLEHLSVKYYEKWINNKR